MCTGETHNYFKSARVYAVFSSYLKLLAQYLSALRFRIRPQSSMTKSWPKDGDIVGPLYQDPTEQAVSALCDSSNLAESWHKNLLQGILSKTMTIFARLRWTNTPLLRTAIINYVTMKNGPLAVCTDLLTANKQPCLTWRLVRRSLVAERDPFIWRLEFWICLILSCNWGFLSNSSSSGLLVLLILNWLIG